MVQPTTFIHRQFSSWLRRKLIFIDILVHGSANHLKYCHIKWKNWSYLYIYCRRNLYKYHTWLLTGSFLRYIVGISVVTGCFPHFTIARERHEVWRVAWTVRANRIILVTAWLDAWTRATDTWLVDGTVTPITFYFCKRKCIFQNMSITKDHQSLRISRNPYHVFFVI